MFWDIHLSRFHPSAFPFFSLIKASFWFVALRQLHSRAQNRKAARFSGSCFLNSKPTEEGKISQKKQRGLEEWHVQEGISLGWRRAESWWENTQVLLCSGSLGHKEMVLWAPKGSGQDPRHRSSCLRQSCLCPMWCENREPPDTECLDSKDASSEHRDLKLEKPFFFFLQATCKLSPNPRLWCMPWGRRSPMTEMECDTNQTGLGTQSPKSSWSSENKVVFPLHWSLLGWGLYIALDHPPSFSIHFPQDAVS